MLEIKTGTRSFKIDRQISNLLFSMAEMQNTDVLDFSNNSGDNAILENSIDCVLSLDDTPVEMLVEALQFLCIKVPKTVLWDMIENRHLFTKNAHVSLIRGEIERLLRYGRFSVKEYRTLCEIVDPDFVNNPFVHMEVFGMTDRDIDFDSLGFEYFDFYDTLEFPTTHDSRKREIEKCVSMMRNVRTVFMYNVMYSIPNGTQRLILCQTFEQPAWYNIFATRYCETFKDFVFPDSLKSIVVTSGVDLKNVPNKLEEIEIVLKDEFFTCRLSKNIKKVILGGTSSEILKVVSFKHVEHLQLWYGGDENIHVPTGLKLKSFFFKSHPRGYSTKPTQKLLMTLDASELRSLTCYANETVERFSNLENLTIEFDSENRTVPISLAKLPNLTSLDVSQPTSFIDTPQTLSQMFSSNLSNVVRKLSLMQYDLDSNDTATLDSCFGNIYPDELRLVDCRNLCTSPNFANISMLTVIFDKFVSMREFDYPLLVKHLKLEKCHIPKNIENLTCLITFNGKWLPEHKESINCEKLECLESLLWTSYHNLTWINTSDALVFGKVLV